jgi:hypothetical protein
MFNCGFNYCRLEAVINLSFSQRRNTIKNLAIHLLSGPLRKQKAIHLWAKVEAIRGGGARTTMVMISMPCSKGKVEHV